LGKKKKKKREPEAQDVIFMNDSFLFYTESWNFSGA
jgi:hypothetical protein